MKGWFRMLYNEFIENTGCRDTDQNFNIYKGLELVYMNTDLSKDEIYKLGKRLVNNGLTKEQQNHNAAIRSQIDALSDVIASDQSYLDKTPFGDKETINYYKGSIRENKRKIKRLKELLYK